MQTIHPFSEEAVDPLADCLRCGVVWPPVATDMPPSTTARTHLLSTFRRQAGILCGCPISPQRIAAFGKISVPAPDRIDNLLKVHI